MVSPYTHHTLEFYTNSWDSQHKRTKTNFRRSPSVRRRRTATDTDTCSPADRTPMRSITSSPRFPYRKFISSAAIYVTYSLHSHHQDRSLARHFHSRHKNCCVARFALFPHLGYSSFAARYLTWVGGYGSGCHSVSVQAPGQNYAVSSFTTF